MWIKKKERIDGRFLEVLDQAYIFLISLAQE